jgi:hypothetical protein
VTQVEPTTTRERSVDDAFALLWDHLVVVDPIEPADAIFCFGSRSRSVPATAAGLFARGVAPVIVVTGGGRMDDGRFEADAYAADLADRGVPSDAIIVERQARHTGENVVLGFDALARSSNPARLVAVSWALAMRRAVATFAHHCPELHVVAVPALPDERRRWEATAVNVFDALGEWDRLDVYAARGQIAPQHRPTDVVDAVRVLRSIVNPEPGPGRGRRDARHPRTDHRAAPATALLRD